MSEQVLVINTQHYLRSYAEFLEACEEEFQTPDFQSRNYTEQPHCGWTETLYEAQEGFSAIEYMQTRLWRYHSNGTIGEGFSLAEALADHQEKHRKCYFD